MTTKKTTPRKTSSATQTKPKGTTKPDAVKSEKPATTATEPKAETKTDNPKRLSALDAAAKVLAESNEPLGAKQMIEAMAAQGYWTSPGGKTPHATLSSAILREIHTKGNDARFKKVERGKFAANG